MPANPVPEAVRQLIADSIDSIAEVEAILLLRRERTRAWNVEEAGKRLYISDTLSRYVLNVLTERGVLSEENGLFRYDPRTPELDSTIAALATAYSTNLVAVTHLVHGKPAESVREFARAFRLRKDS
jgi:hypothetical protein